MNVLICDNDAPTRFVLKRILTQNLGWTAVETGDGVEALDILSSKRFDLLLLDLEMPQCDGFEVLEVLRASPKLQDLPVVIVSQERRREIIVRLTEYNVAGYLLKPLRAEHVAARLSGLNLKATAHYGVRGEIAELCLTPDNPAMLIDGNLDFRHFFITEAERYGPVRGAESAAAGLAQFRQSPVELVFVGTKLGVMGAEMLVRKLRDASGDRRVRIISVVEGANGQVHTFTRRAEDRVQAGWDDQMTRTFVPSVFATEIQRFVRRTGAVAAFTKLLPEFRLASASAVEQVFGMMLGAEVETLYEPVDITVALQSTITMDLADQFKVSVIVQLSEAAVDEVNMVLIGEDASAGDRAATASELVNLTAGRLHAHAGDKEVKSVCSLPETITFGTFQPLPELPPEQGHIMRFRTSGGKAPFAVTLKIEALQPVALAS
ncbi:MAG: response regulator [Vicinamibacterales bacterium]